MSQLPMPQSYVIDEPGSERRYHLSVYNLGLACCAIEYAAATIEPAVMAAVRIGEESDDLLEDVSVMVVSGTCTIALAPAVRRLYDSLPEPRHVISFGACSTSGGPYWDSYSVVKGISSIVPVDVFVPGCPPRPETLLDAVRQLRVPA